MNIKSIHRSKQSDNKQPVQTCYQGFHFTSPLSHRESENIHSVVMFFPCKTLWLESPHLLTIHILIFLIMVSYITWQLYNSKEVNQQSQLRSSSGKLKWLQVQWMTWEEKFCNGAITKVSCILLNNNTIIVRKRA